MLLNFDLWYEVISHLKYPEDWRTLCSLAITSHSISNLALDVLWRSDGTIQAIVSIINTFSPSPNEPILHRKFYQEDDTEDSDGDDEDHPSSSSEGVSSWVLSKPIPPAACERALGYLARIRYLETYDNGFPEEQLWSLLSISLNPRGPLLPNLKSWEVNFEIFDHIQYLVPLLSPSLKILMISNKRQSKVDVILTFLNLANGRVSDLEDFSYSGPLSHRIPEAIELFSNLKSVYFHPNYVPRLKAPITIVQFLVSLPFLRSLVCSIEIFSPLTDEDRFCHTELKEIMIKSEPTALRKLFQICVFPSVTDITLLSERILNVEGIRSSYPNARKLVLYVNSVDPPLETNNISSLLSLSTMSFVLLARKHTLTTFDLCDFAKYWPDIRILKTFESNKPWSDPLPPLVLYNYPGSLDHNVSLLSFRPLDDKFKSWNLKATDVPPQAWGCRSSLRSLFLYYSDYAVMRIAEQCTLVEHLLRLFPSLEELHFVRQDCPQEDQVNLWDVLVEFGCKV